MTERRIPASADFNGESPTEDKKATREAEYLANGRDLARSENIKDAINVIALIALAVLATGVIISLIFWFFHLLAPATWHFLSDSSLRRIETIIFSGILVGVGQTYLSRHIR